MLFLLLITITFINEESKVIETIKDCFVGCGVRQKEDECIVTYFTAYSAAEFTEKLTKDILSIIQRCATMLRSSA
jgi:hypothetical protein